MSCKRSLLYFALCISMADLAATALAQTDHTQTWAQDVAFMEQMTPSEAATQQATLLQIRAEVALWLSAHPSTGIHLSALPTLPLGADQAAAQLQELRKVIAVIAQQDPSHPFHLGLTEVEVSATLSPLSPTAESITQEEM